jgi:type VI protein secretion system component VasF
VISTAIAVLIMAALGAVMWVGFQAIWGNASSQTTNQINQIGAP